MKLMLLFIALVISAGSYGQSFTSNKTDEGIWILERGEKVLFYQAATKSTEGRFPRADYIHPLFGMDGFELTEDFPGDHLHHRGVFWAWHRVYIGDQQLGDAWECRDFSWDVRDFGITRQDNNSIDLSASVFWKSADWLDEEKKEKPFVEESVLIRVHKRETNYRVIDFTISLTALEENMHIAGSDDEKGYSGFSVRMKMPDDLTFKSAEGNVSPVINQLTAGSWMDMSGSLSLDGSKAGIIIIQSPENPNFPQPWILRKKGSMQNPVYPGREPVPLHTDQPTILNYRLVIYRGDIDEAVVKKLAEIQ